MTRIRTHNLRAKRARRHASGIAPILWRWSRERKARERAERLAVESWPDGTFERNGTMMFICRSCDKAFPLEVDLSEFDPDVAYCGGSPRCLP